MNLFRDKHDELETTNDRNQDEMMKLEHPNSDLADRIPVWDAMQMFWMDAEPETFLKHTAELCAKSKYTLEELKLIYWNEVKPAVSFNIGMSVAPEYAGFKRNLISERILEKHRYGKRLPIFWLHQDSNTYWKAIKNAIIDYEEGFEMTFRGRPELVV